MKLLAFLFFIAVVTTFTYYFSDLLIKTRNIAKKQKNSKIPIISAIFVAVVLLALLALGMYRSAKAPDMQCSSIHTTPSFPPATLSSAMDYFLLGNYDYDRGDCQKAIVDYTKSLEMDPNYQQAYNNRGYTSMRMRNYKDALPDLDKAIEMNPNYIQALMNRGDIHNYYYAIDRKMAIEDYEKVISLGGKEETSVCGHLFLARHNGWKLSTLFNIPRQLIGSCG